LPLPSPRVALQATDPRQKLLEDVLAEDGIRQEQLKLKGLRDLFFSKGERAALCLPTALTCESGEDDGQRGSQKLVLSFALPRGSYATLLIKRITARAEQ
jgi:tRNA pseudouridine13 synthase